MKIAVIGASGKAGSLIAKEALLRRHEVTAIVRDKAKLTLTGCKVLQKNLFGLNCDDLKGFDIIVDAFGTGANPIVENEHQTSLNHLTELIAKLPNVRLMVVGGAASLYTDHWHQQRVLETIPEQWRAVPSSMLTAFEQLQKSSVNWTYFSPANTFDAKGPRTGKYRLGQDELVRNSDGESYLSYADYAVAMLDEIEEGRFIGKRFTAASEKTPNKDGYYGTESKKPVFEGISTYRPHLNFELAGKTFHLIMDNSGDVIVKFLTGTLLEYTENGQTHCEPYQCAKGAEKAYFVNFEFSGSEPRTNVTLILDTMTRLVTVVHTQTGYKAEFPYLCDHVYDFGAIETPGFTLPTKRPGYTTDLVGKRIEWHYSPEFAIIHVYYHPNYIRAAFSPKMLKILAASAPAPSQDAEASRREHPYDEKAVYVKMRDGLYVVSFTEQNMSRNGKTGNSLLFLMDTDRLHDVGRSFGRAGQRVNGEHPLENYLFGAYGKYTAPNGDEDLESNSPFYTV